MKEGKKCQFCNTEIPIDAAKCWKCGKEQIEEDNSFVELLTAITEVVNSFTARRKQFSLPKNTKKKHKHDCRWDEQKDIVLLTGMKQGLSIGQIKTAINEQFGTLYTKRAVSSRITVYKNEDYRPYIPKTQEQMKQRKLRYFYGNNNNPT